MRTVVTALVAALAASFVLAAPAEAKGKRGHASKPHAVKVVKAHR